MDKTNDPEHEEVRDPVTGKPITDPTLRIAVKEGHYRIVDGKTQIHWAGLMGSRRAFPIPDYSRPLTESERELWRKLREDTLIGVSAVSEMLGYRTLEAGIRFLFRRYVPVYCIAGTYRVFAGDVVKAVESLRLDRAEDRSVWERYLKASFAWRDRQKRRK